VKGGGSKNSEKTKEEENEKQSVKTKMKENDISGVIGVSA